VLHIYLVTLLSPISRPCSLRNTFSPLLSCLLGTGHTQMDPSILRSHCYSKYRSPLHTRRDVTMPLATPGIVTGIVIIIATVAGCGRVANGKAESQRASCCVECRIRGKLHSPPLLLVCLSKLSSFHSVLHSLFSNFRQICRIVCKNVIIIEPLLFQMNIVTDIYIFSLSCFIT